MDRESIELEAPGVGPSRRSAGWKVSIALISAIFLVAAGFAVITFSTEPTATREGATKKTAMLVEVIPAEHGDYHPNIVATGTVMPSREVELRPQVAGRVTDLDDHFTLGGFVAKGDRLMRLEAADYRNVVAQRKSELRQAESELAVEQGRQTSARADYKYMGEQLPTDNTDLVLRKPQLAAAEEKIRAARAALNQASLDVRRTSIVAPFDAHVLERDVNVGSQVTVSSSLGRLVGIDTYWVAVELPLSKVRWVSFDAATPSPVKVRNRTAWADGEVREGAVHRLVGAVDGDTRMARVIAEIEDPLVRRDDTTGPRLMVGEFVEVEITGTLVRDVVRLSRDYLRTGDTVWVMEDGQLAVREIQIELQDANYVYIRAGVDAGESVVVTNLSTVTQGAPLRLENAQVEPSQ